MSRIRLDHLLVSRGLAETRSKAQALVLAGAVRVNGVAQKRPAQPIDEASSVEVVAALPYVSRGGFKLAHALDTFGLEPNGLVGLDAGASTGGFTDVLLQRGAKYVYAVDVGYGILDWRLRQDPRVITVERTNIRYLTQLPPLPNTPLDAPAPHAECAVIDVAFISLRIVLPAVQHLILPGAWVVALIKPQFEAGAHEVGRGGVVRDPAIHERVIRDVLAAATTLGFVPRGQTRSPLTGPAGNVEFLAWLEYPVTAEPRR